MSAEFGPLVETDWLEAHLGDPDIRVIDGSWYLPAMERDAKAEYRQGHIPGAVYFDIDEISDPSSALPHTLPSPENFSAAVAKLGVNETDRIVVYDGAGLFSAARVWWMLRAMGAKNVAVLNGGLKAWIAEERPLDADADVPAPGTFHARLNPDFVRTVSDVLAAVSDGGVSIVDARPAGRFTGAVAEPRAGLRSGHIPASTNTPVDRFLQDDGRLKPAEALRDVFDEAGTDISKPVITSCGSGVTAAVPFLALTLLGKSDVALYDGSWTEWGGRADTPVETG